VRDIGYIGAGFAVTTATLGLYAASISRRLHRARLALQIDARERAGRRS
jgi:hypothetical protein